MEKIRVKKVRSNESVFNSLVYEDTQFKNTLQFDLGLIMITTAPVDPEHLSSGCREAIYSYDGRDVSSHVTIYAHNCQRVLVSPPYWWLTLKNVI